MIKKNDNLINNNLERTNKVCKKNIIPKKLEDLSDNKDVKSIKRNLEHDRELQDLIFNSFIKKVKEKSIKRNSEHDKELQDLIFNLFIKKVKEKR